MHKRCHSTQRSGGRTTEDGGLRTDCFADNARSAATRRGWFSHTSTPRPQTYAQGRFRGVDERTFSPQSRIQQHRVYSRRSPEAIHGPNPLRRRPISGFLRKESRFEASPSCFRPRPLVPGLFWFRARVILLTDGPTRSTQRPPVPGTIPPFPHPEPPLLLVLLNDDSPLRSSVLGPGSNDNVCATVEKVKHPTRQKIFIPCRTRG